MASPTPPALDPDDVPAQRGRAQTVPHAHGRPREAPARRPLGLTRFGVNLVTHAPGAESALRHWHTLEDEFVWMLEGEVVLVTNAGEQVLRAGQCAGYPAGGRDGHHFVNRSDAPARYLEVGSRIDGDNAFYPDDDLMWVESEDGVYAAHKDGRRYPSR
jgi:uncharacterized cupin superfamily protein